MMTESPPPEPSGMPFPGMVTAFTHPVLLRAPAPKLNTWQGVVTLAATLAFFGLVLAVMFGALSL